MRFRFVLLLTFGPGHTPVKTNVVGTYIFVTSHAPMRFQKKLVLNCDATVSAHFAGDMMNDKLDGTWAMVSDTLRITLKPYINPEGKAIFPHWHETMHFRIRGKKLLPIVPLPDSWKNVDKKTRAEFDQMDRNQVFVSTEKASCH